MSCGRCFVPPNSLVHVLFVLTLTERFLKEGPGEEEKNPKKTGKIKEGET